MHHLESPRKRNEFTPAQNADIFLQELYKVRPGTGKPMPGARPSPDQTPGSKRLPKK